MPNARTKAAGTQAGGTTSTMTLSKTGTDSKITPAATAADSKSRRAPAPQSTDQLAGVVLTGLVKRPGGRPKSKGRGRQEIPVPDTFAQDLAATLDDPEACVVYVGDKNATQRNVKALATKWIKANGGKTAVAVHFIEDKDETAKLTAEQREAGEFVTSYWAERKVTAAA